MAFILQTALKSAYSFKCQDTFFFIQMICLAMSIGDSCTLICGLCYKGNIYIS